MNCEIGETTQEFLLLFKIPLISFKKSGWKKSWKTGRWKKTDLQNIAAENLNPAILGTYQRDLGHIHEQVRSCEQRCDSAMHFSSQHLDGQTNRWMDK